MTLIAGLGLALGAAPADAATTHRKSASVSMPGMDSGNRMIERVWYHNVLHDGTRASSVRATATYCNWLDTGAHGHGDYYDVDVDVYRYGDNRHLTHQHFTNWYCGQTHGLPSRAYTGWASGLRVRLSAHPNIRNFGDNWGRPLVTNVRVWHLY